MSSDSQMQDDQRKISTGWFAGPKISGCHFFQTRVFGWAAIIIGASLVLLPLLAAEISSSEEREIIRRKENLATAKKLFSQGQSKVWSRDYESAYHLYQDALSRISSGSALDNVQDQKGSRIMVPRTDDQGKSAFQSAQFLGRFRRQATAKFASTTILYARWLIRTGRYMEAQDALETILLPQYKPGYRPAIHLLAQLKKTAILDQASAADLVENQKEIARLLAEGKTFRTTGYLDLAQMRYEQVLKLAPYYTAARQAQQLLHQQKQKYYQDAGQEGRSRLLWGATKNWEQAGGFLQDGHPKANSTTDGTEEIRSKLNHILLPRVEFRDTTVREAIAFLKERAKELDLSPANDKQRGVNIVLKLGNDKKPVAVADSTQKEPADPNVRIDLSLKNVPLYEVLRYVSELAGLKLKIERYAVSIVPLSELADQLITKEYQVLPSFLPIAPKSSASNSVDEKSKTMGVRVSAQEYLQAQGVPFPKGSFANYMPTGSRLTIRNTADALSLIDSIVNAANEAAPLQVQIESKFVNISQNNLKQLGFDWLLGPVSLSKGLTVSGGDTADPSRFPMASSDTGQPIGINAITSNLRHEADSSASFHSMDSLISQGFNKSLLTSLFGISGILTRAQFQVVMRALSQTKGVDLVSAPKLTTRSGQKATIRMIRTFPYPTEFHPPQIPQKGIVASRDVLPNNAFISQTVTPTTPIRFEVRNTGITMEVEPVVGPDGFTIDLNLSPEIVDFDGFVNYGVPILGVVNQAVTGIPSSTVLTQNTIYQPIFSTRKVATSVSIWDGQTIALGGLMREDIQKVEDKIPILGHIPFIGRLFRSNLDQKIKENLIIFVTARLIDAQGKPIRSDEGEF